MPRIRGWATILSARRKRILWLHSLSSIHVGAGDAVGVIDLPITREKVTNWPYLPGSAVKGVFRDACSDSASAALVKEAFGPDTKSGDDTLDGAGQLWFADARILCFPVRSLTGTFAWVTCPLALMRHSRDLGAAGLAPLTHSVGTAIDTEILVTADSIIKENNHVFLEDLDLQVNPGNPVDALAATLAAALLDTSWASEFTKRFAIVSDDVFTFLVETCTEVAAHIRISNERKTVEKGALWYEESVPAETIFTMPLVASPRKNGPDASGLFSIVAGALKKPIQIGGKASVGRGLISAKLTSKE